MMIPRSLLNQVVATTPTIGSNVEEVIYKNIHFIMWDIGGQESLRATWATYYVNTKVPEFIIRPKSAIFMAYVRQSFWLLTAQTASDFIFLLPNCIE